MIDPNAQFAQLQNVFAPQQQMALQTAANVKALTQQYNAQNAGLRGLAGSMPDAPQLKFGVDVPSGSIAEGITQGLGNATNNFLQMRNYGQQQQAVKDMATQYQQQQAYARDLAQKQANETQQRFGNASQAFAGIDPRLQTAFDLADAANKEKLIAEYGTTSFIPYRQKIEKTGGVQADFAAGDQTVKELGQRSIPLYNQDAQGVAKPLTPQQAAQAKTYGQEVDTVEQARNRALDITSKIQTLNANAPKVATAAKANALDLAGKQLSNEQAALNVAQEKVNLKYADALKQIDVLTGKGELDKAQTAKTNLDQGRTRYDQAIAAYPTWGNGKIKLFNSQMKSLGLPYELPEKAELKATTEKGKVKEFYDAETGIVTKPVRRK